MRTGTFAAKPARLSSGGMIATARESSLESIDLGGIDLHPLSVNECVEWVVGEARSSDRAKMIVTLNVDHLVLLQSEGLFRAAYAKASLRVIDGAPIAALASIIERRSMPRAPGSDLLVAVCARAASEGLSVYFFGGAPGVAEMAARQMQDLHPGLVVAGVSAPSAGIHPHSREAESAVSEIRAAAPNVVFACLGSPRQEVFVAHHLGALPASVVICAGAAVDFAAGTKIRAPRFARRLGLEWAFRLVQEPTRLWRRYLIQDIAFIPIAFSEVSSRLWDSTISRMQVHRNRTTERKINDD